MLVSGAVFATTATNKGDVSKGDGKNLSARTHSLEKQVQALQYQLNSLKPQHVNVGKEKNKVKEYGSNSLVEMYAHGPAVVTSPALGVRRSLDDASDLMVKWSSMNEDLVILKTRQKMDNYAIENGIQIPERPVIALSGYVEGQLAHKSNDKKYDIDLSGAELDIIGEAAPWATGTMISTYDSAASPDGKNISNSKLRIDRAFLTIGQLNKFPVYLTIGQIFAPFGSYSSHMINDPSTKVLGRTKDRMIILGYSQGGFSAQAYGFSGDTHVGPKKNTFDHAGFNADYGYSKDKFQVKVGASIIGNLAESDDMQKNVFASKDSKDTSENITSRVCGLDGRIKLGYAPFALFAEYVGAAKRFDYNDLGFNGVGAKPQAINIEGSVEFEIKGKPNNFAVGYGQTWQALALNLPRNTFFAEYDIAIFKNAIIGIEYKHDINYGAKDKGSSNALKQSEVPVIGGRHSNTVTASLGVYF